jgi:hypothetical protein
MKFWHQVILKWYIKIIIHIEKDQESELSRNPFLKNMKNPLFTKKAVQTGRVEVEANSFGSAMLPKLSGFFSNQKM